MTAPLEGQGFTLTNVAAGYRSSELALRSVNARFPAGRVAAILGPNGAGKSTLLRVLAGLLPLRSGAVTFAAKDVCTLAPALRAQRIALVAQQPSAAAGFSVREIVALAGVRARVSSAEIDAALALLGLRERAAAPFAALSIGQQQRVAVARAFAQLRLASRLQEGVSAQDSKTTKKIKQETLCAILADEPASAMDPHWTLRVFSMLKRAAELGVVVVCALHDLSSALRYADDALLLDSAGAAVAHGPVEETLASPALARVFAAQFATLEGPAEGAGGDEPWTPRAVVALRTLREGEAGYDPPQ